MLRLQDSFQTVSRIVFFLFLVPTLGHADDPNIFVKLSKKVVPSVVNISTATTVKGYRMYGSPDDLFRQFFGDMFRGMPQQRKPMPRQAPKAMSLGTGFIIDKDGLILTNNHVVDQADEIKISFTEDPDEKASEAEVVGRDPEIDIALIRVKTKRSLTPLEFGDSDELQVGEYVVAVGNPFGRGHSVSHGIISAKGRQAPDFPLANYLQTDAPINPGNSGGPLVNLEGKVIGINNAIDQRAQGIGFAIPSNIVKQILPQLKKEGTVSRGYIGVGITELTPEIADNVGAPKGIEGPLVTNVYPDEPAAKAGVKPYDVILEFDGKKVTSGSELIAAVTAVPVGKTVQLKVMRGTKEKTLSIKVDKRPGSQMLASRGRHQDEDPKRNKERVETGMALRDLSDELARDLGLSPKTNGVVVAHVEYGSPADQAGLMRGDVILEVNRKTIKDVEGFYDLVKPKKSYLLRVRRGDAQGRDLFQVVILDLKKS